MMAANPIPAMTPARLFLTCPAAPIEKEGVAEVVVLVLASVGTLMTEVDSLAVPGGTVVGGRTSVVLDAD